MTTNLLSAAVLLTETDALPTPAPLVTAPSITVLPGSAEPVALKHRFACALPSRGGSCDCGALSGLTS